MSEHSQILDPFALPTETTGRFRMLLAFAFVAAWGLSAMLVDVPNFAVHGFTIEPEVQERISFAIRHGWHALSVEEREEIFEWRRQHEVWGSVAWQFLRLLISIAILTALTLGAAWIRHLVRHRQSLLYPCIDESLMPRVAAEVRRLALRLAGLDKLEIRIKSGFLDGLAFGAPGQEAVVIAGSPRQEESGWSNLHRAVFLHELGHLINKDVGWREWVRSLLLALSILAGLSLILSGILRTPTAVTFLAWTVETSAVLALAWMLWAGLVRSREIEADWRVVSWGYGPELGKRLSLHLAFGVSENARKARGLAGWRSNLAQRVGHWLPWRFHPPNQVRLEALNRPEGLFAVRLDLAALSGLSVALLASRLGPISLDCILLYGVVGAPFFLFPTFVPVMLLIFFGGMSLFFLVLTYLVTGALGTQTLRAALAKTAGTPVKGLLGPSLLFAVSLEIGLWVFFRTPLNSWSDLPLILTWVGVITMLMRIWLGYVSVCGRQIIGRWSGRCVPRRTIRMVRMLAALVLSLLVWPAVLARGLILLVSDSDLLRKVSGSLQSPAEELDRLVQITGVLWACSTLLAAILALSGLGLGWCVTELRDRSCCHCQHSSGPGALVGRNCASCGKELAVWATFRPDHMLRQAVENWRSSE